MRPHDLRRIDLLAFMNDIAVAVHAGYPQPIIEDAVRELLERVSHELAAEERTTDRAARSAIRERQIADERFAMELSAAASAFATGESSVEAVLACTRRWLLEHETTDLLLAACLETALPH